MTCLSREDVLAKPRPRDHAALLYVDDQTLCNAIALYAGAALDRGEAMVVVATQPHLEGMLAELARTDRDVQAVHRSGQLECLDAEERLNAFMDGPQLNDQAFLATFSGPIEAALRRFPGLSAYGEMVDQLWQRDNRAAAHRLEQLWNELIEQYGLRLLCGYRADVFDARIQAGLDSICQTHSHLIPVEDYDRFDQAVDTALREVVHPGDASALRAGLVGRCGRGTHMPDGQAALFALHDILPMLAHDVRLRARHHYQRIRGE